MDARLQSETDNLVKSWMRHEQDLLRDYLVAGVEDPRLNVQSILTRHFLLHALFGPRHAKLMEQELRFAIVMNWLTGLFKQNQADFPVLLHALRQGADNAEGIEIPAYVRQTFARLPATVEGTIVPDYLTALLLSPGGHLSSEGQGVLNTFQTLWASVLATAEGAPISVLEPACGSANDYRFLSAFGLARWLDYTGFDLCEKNILNARTLFPSANFQVGNLFETPWPAQAFDYGFVHDLFEHLSPTGLEAAVAELCRVTRRGLCLGFFNMAEAEEHAIRPFEDYYWNTLSLARTRELFERRQAIVQVAHIATFLKWRFGCDSMHNTGAYTFFVHSGPA